MLDVILKGGLFVTIIISRVIRYVVICSIVTRLFKNFTASIFIPIGGMKVTFIVRPTRVIISWIIIVPRTYSVEFLHEIRACCTGIDISFIYTLKKINCGTSNQRSPGIFTHDHVIIIKQLYFLFIYIGVRRILRISL